jgi:hypothetical protein
LSYNRIKQRVVSYQKKILLAVVQHDIFKLAPLSNDANSALILGDLEFDLQTKKISECNNLKGISDCGTAPHIKVAAIKRRDVQ